jgi:hypothetical protein
MKTSKQKTTTGFKAVLVLSVFMWLFNYTARADGATDRAYILSKLKFYYVVNPNTSDATSRLSLAASASDPRTVFNSNALMDSMKVFLKCLPLAYADYFTCFSSTSVSAFNQLFDNGLNGDLIRCYWNNRTAVKAAATARGITNFTQASTEIAIVLGITTSEMEH